MFICTHKDFDNYIDLPQYSIVCSEHQLQNNYNIPIIYENSKSELLPKQISYGEYSRINFICNNIDLPEFVGFCHYSRQIDIGKLPIDILNTFDVVVLKPMSVFPVSIIEQYKSCHNINDFNEILSIIKHYYPNDIKSYVNIFNTDTSLYYGNIFIMKTELAKQYCNFINTIFTVFDKYKGFNTQQDIDNYIQENINKGFYSFNANIEYQRRLHGFIIERLTHAFIKIHCNNIYEY